jgi:oligopeptide/dipeptide ABC transporter ATP-binding protein
VNLLRALQRRMRLSYLFIAHDLAVVKHIADRIAVMYLGQIVETASKRALFEAPRHPYTQALLAAIPRPEPGVPRERRLVAGDVPSPLAPPPGCRFHTRCPRAMPRCSQEVPIRKEVSRNHSVACHLYD